MKRIISILIAFVFLGQVSQASSAMGVASMKVIRALFVEASLPLVFAAAVPGSPTALVIPGASNSAQFKVRGEPHMAYTIRLPDHAMMVVNGGNLPSQQIKVSTFTSFPDSTGTLDEQGEQMLFIGATREGLRPDQEQGTYYGTYEVEAIY